MLEVKDNFRNRHNDNKCRACKVRNETLENVLSECEALHQDDSTTAHIWDLRTDSTSTLKVVSKKVETS